MKFDQAYNVMKNRRTTYMDKNGKIKQNNDGK